MIRLLLIPMQTTGFFLQVGYLELKKLLAAGRLEDRQFWRCGKLKSSAESATEGGIR
jgi:hypothetical protein